MAGSYVLRSDADLAAQYNSLIEASINMTNHNSVGTNQAETENWMQWFRMTPRPVLKHGDRWSPNLVKPPLNGMVTGLNAPYFDVFFPIAPQACSLELHGQIVRMGSGDGKWTCFDRHMMPDTDGNIYESFSGKRGSELVESGTEPFIIYSLGSNNEFDYEHDVLEACPRCVVHIFDCFPPYLGKTDRSLDQNKFESFLGKFGNRAKHHNQCIGSKPPGAKENWKTWTETVAELGHRGRIELLKVDIEGSEFELFENLGVIGSGDDDSVVDDTLPRQIQAELHIWDWKKEAHSKRVLGLAKGMQRLNYVTLAREDNPFNPSCSEFVFIRRSQHKAIRK